MAGVEAGDQDAAGTEGIGARDLERETTFRAWYARACRLANALTGLGLDVGPAGRAPSEGLPTDEQAIYASWPPDSWGR